MSIAARHKEQSAKAKADPGQKTTLKKSSTTGGSSDKKAGKRKEALDQAFGKGGVAAGPSSAPLAGTRRVDDKAPSLTLDIRNSLMLPGYVTPSHALLEESANDIASRSDFLSCYRNYRPRLRHP